MAASEAVSRAFTRRVQPWGMLLTNATWWLIGVAVDQQEVTDTGSALSLAELLDRPARAAP